MRVELKLDEAQLQAFERLVEERQRRAMDMTPALEEVADDFLELERRVFDTQGRVVLSAGWRKLSKSWTKFKQTHGLSPRILEMTQGGGRLRRALTVKGAPYQLRHVTDEEVVVGTNLGIARIHQKGGKITLHGHAAKIPSRKFVRLRQVDKVRWIGELQSYLSDDVNSRAAVRQRLGL